MKALFIFLEYNGHIAISMTDFSSIDKQEHIPVVFILFTKICLYEGVKKSPFLAN